jgi:ADP-ribose pyrophosphatase
MEAASARARSPVETDVTIKPWRILDQKTVYAAQPYIEVSLEKVELPDGRVIADYHHLRAGAFVTIIAETADGRLMALRQYRHGVRRIGLTLPGGRIDAGEAPLAAAQRELLEETGAVAEHWSPLSSWETSCTYGFSTSHYFHARNARTVRAPETDDLEGGEIILLTPKEALDAVQSQDFLSLGHAAPIAFFLLDKFTRR